MLAGWRKKAEKLRMIILSADLDQPISAAMAESFEIQRRFNKGQCDAEFLMAEMERIRPLMTQWDGLWEPFSDMRGEPDPVYGWSIRATMYQVNGQNWWLVGAERKPSEHLPDKDVVVLGKILEILGGDIKRDAVSVGELEDNARAGVVHMWTWFNQAPLYEVQVSKAKKNIRVVPRGAPESDGYVKMKNIAADGTAS